MNDGTPKSDPMRPGLREPQRSALKDIAVVQCNGFRCLAYRDVDNKWRDFHTGQALSDVQEVVHTFAN